jgi:hypothetical protein
MLIGQYNTPFLEPTLNATEFFIVVVKLLFVVVLNGTLTPLSCNVIPLTPLPFVVKQSLCVIPVASEFGGWSICKAEVFHVLIK